MEKKGVITVCAFAILALVAFYFDTEIVRFAVSLQSQQLNDFFLGMTSVTVEIIIFFLLTSLFLWRERKRKWILPLWAALGFSSIVSFLIKILVQRPRPFQLDLVAIFPVLESASFLTWNFSFPSLQAALVFSAIPILSKEFPRLKWVWIVFAGLVALSRVYFGLHFMSDVIVGGLIGFLVGSLIVRLEKENNFWENVYGKIFRKR